MRTYLQQDAAMPAHRSLGGGGGPWKRALMKQAADLQVTVTNSELEALILETNLIKQKKPKYNVLMKDDKNYVYVRVSEADTFPRIELVRRPMKDRARYFGPYLSAMEIRETLTTLRRVFPYRNCKMSIEPQTVSLYATSIPHPLSPHEKGENSNEENNFKHIHSPSPMERGLGGEVNAENKEGLRACPASERSEWCGVRVAHRDRPTPCLDYHIKQCCAPCIGSVAPDDYRKTAIEGVVDFLKGRTEDAVTLLEERMRVTARDRKFEQAAKLRDALRMIQRLQEKQIVSDTSGEDADIFGVAAETSRAHVVLLKERNGKVIDESSFTLAIHAQTSAEVLSQFLPQYYADAPEVPPLLILAEEIEEKSLLEQWLTEKRGTKVVIHIPERGKKGKLLDLAEENAREKVQHFETKWEAAARNVEDALKELKTALSLPFVPKRIEGYDISHLGGTETVGSMSVFVDGKPKNDQYRSFTLKTIAEHDVDDYRSLQEVLRRRLLHLTQDLKHAEQTFRQNRITLRKARAVDQGTIGKMMRSPSARLDCSQITFREFLVAERAKKVIGFGRIHRHEDGTTELASLFVSDRERGRGLGGFLVRNLLKKVKRGKVYVVTDPPLEEYYARVGVRTIHTAPKPILAKAKRCQKRFGANTSNVLMMIETHKNTPDPSLSARPDLLLIDGGKGQLSTVVSVLKELNLSIPVIGLAKKEEEIFTPGRSMPLVFAQPSPSG
ncbi:MAG: GNAT family N-acetyltransferase, partial [Candidatus Peregrinibacteria bacterium]